MLRLFVLLLALVSSARSIQRPFFKSAATDSQIKYAIENKYDDTGPGAKGREYAYNTYRTLEDALVGYLEDPDTKLPDFEREKAVQKLLQAGNQFKSSAIREYPKTVEEYTGYKVPQAQPQIVSHFRLPEQSRLPEKSYQNPGYLSFKDFEIREPLDNTIQKEPFRLQRIQPVKTRPVNFPHYTRPQAEETLDPFNPNPKYSFSYGVHDKHTGDSKSAHETRDGGIVRGFYTFLDADGKQRTVHYTADDKLGFQATVQRTQMNAQ